MNVRDGEKSQISAEPSLNDSASLENRVTSEFKDKKKMEDAEKL